MNIEMRYRKIGEQVHVLERDMIGMESVEAESEILREIAEYIDSMGVHVDDVSGASPELRKAFMELQAIKQSDDLNYKFSIVNWLFAFGEGPCFEREDLYKRSGDIQGEFHWVESSFVNRNGAIVEVLRLDDEELDFVFCNTHGYQPDRRDDHRCYICEFRIEKEEYADQEDIHSLRYG